MSYLTLMTKKLSLKIGALSLLTVPMLANNLVEVHIPTGVWTLIGVPGAFMEGSGTGEIKTTGQGYWWSDTNNSLHSNKIMGIDGNALQDEYNSSKHMVGFIVSTKASTDGDMNVTVSAELGNKVLDPDLPRRKMYLSTTGLATSSDINISYQSDLEGEMFYVKTVKSSGTTQHLYGYFNSAYGSANPYVLKTIKTTSDKYTFKIRDIFDMNLSDNTGKDGQSGEIYDFSYSSNISKLSSYDKLKIFRLDGSLSGWESFFSNISDSANDFDSLVAGSGYWVYFSSTSSERNGSNKGFVFGDGWINSDLYGNSTILSDKSNLGGNAQNSNGTYKTSRQSGHSLLSGSDGWRMLSFPDGYIRHSPTGLILEINTISSSGKAEYTIYDELEKEKVFVRLYSANGNTDVNATEFAKSTNMAIARAIDEGNVSKSFNIRAFSSGDGNVTLLSDKRFKIADLNSSSATDDVISKVWTINKVSISSNLTTSIVSSKYGEYGLVVTVNNDGEGNVSGSLHSAYTNKGKMSVNDTSFNLTVSGNRIKSLLSQVTTALGSNYKATILDLDLNDQNDSILIVGSSPFYVLDNTFTKVYRIDEKANRTVYFDKGDDSTETSISLTLSGDSNETKTVLTAINNALTDFDANSSTNSEINTSIFVTTINPDYRNFDIKEDGTGNIFTKVYSSDPLALGSVTKVYSIDDLAKADISKSVVSLEYPKAFPSNPFGAGSLDFNISLDGVFVKTSTDCSTFALAVNNNTSIPSAYVNCSYDEDSYKDKLTVSGYFLSFDLNSSLLSSDVTEINSSGGVALQNVKTLTDDLTYMPIYTPDYPTSDGVLYLMRENGYLAKSILTAVNSGSSVSWRYLDLTVPADEWLSESFDYNLFSTEIENGYFVRIAQQTKSDIKVDASIGLEFIQHYNNNETNGNFATAGAVDNLFNASLSATVSNSNNEESTTVTANIHGKEYRMIGSGSFYTLNFNQDDLQNINLDDQNITVKAYDEFGNSGSDEVEFDILPPAKPVLEFFDGKTLFIGSASNDITGFNIYKSGIDDRIATDPSNNNWVKYLTASNDYKTCVGSCDGYYGNSVDEFYIRTVTPSSPKTIGMNLYQGITFLNYSIYSSATTQDQKESAWSFAFSDSLNKLYPMNIVSKALLANINTNYEDYNFSIENNLTHKEVNITYANLRWYIDGASTTVTTNDPTSKYLICYQGWWFVSSSTTTVDQNTSKACNIDLNVTYWSSSTTSNNEDRNTTVDYQYDKIGTEIDHSDNNTTLKFMLYNICADAPDFDTNNSDWRVVAVDGNPEMGSNFRASDIAFIPDWFSIYKNASVLEVNETNNTYDNKPYIYNSSCKYSTSATNDNGVILTHDNNSSYDHSYIRIAYDTVSTSSVSSDIPVIRKLSLDTNCNPSYLATIQFAKSEFVGDKKTLLIDINHSKLYKTTFDDLYDSSECFVLTNYLTTNELNQTIEKKK